MKRVLPCVMLVLVAAVSANAADVILKNAGLDNNEFTVTLSGSENTAIIELWITFQDAPGAGPGPQNGNLGDGAGNAVWVSSQVGLASVMNDNSPLQASSPVEWDKDNGADGGVAAPGGLSTFTRGSFGSRAFADYGIIWQDGTAGNFPSMTTADTWQANSGGFGNDGIILADSIQVQGMVQLAAGEYQKVFFPSDAAASPAWEEGGSYDGTNVTFSLSGDTEMVRGSKQGNPNKGANIRIHVIPEPASLALLAVGGLTALRRQRRR